MTLNQRHLSHKRRAAVPSALLCWVQVAILVDIENALVDEAGENIMGALMLVGIVLSLLQLILQLLHLGKPSLDPLLLRQLGLLVRLDFCYASSSFGPTLEQHTACTSVNL